MDINHAPAKPRDHVRRHAFQISREHDQPGIAEGLHQLVRVGVVPEDGGRHAGASGTLECAGTGMIRDDTRDPSVRGSLERVEECLEIGPGARRQHGDGDRSRGAGPHRVQGARATGREQVATVTMHFSGSNGSGTFKRTQTIVWSRFNDTHLQVPALPADFSRKDIYFNHD